MEHIIFLCKHARAVWKAVNVNIDVISEEFTSVTDWDRYDVVFQGVTLNSITSAHRILYHLASHMHIYPTTSLDPHILHSNSSFSKWKTPPVGTVKFNIDGSFDYETNRYGIGVVIRDHSGTCLGTKGSHGDGALNPEAVECMAIREYLFWELRKNFSKIQIEADAKLVIESINGSSSLIYWEKKNLIKEIQYLSSKFSFCVFISVPRSDNQVADKIAKTARTSSVNSENYGTPLGLEDIQDTMGMGSNRRSRPSFRVVVNKAWMLREAKGAENLGSEAESKSFAEWL
ncbi:uncharacterized protein LOC113296521 [Papaver somniferum]|uniref:uncharacterized protein LOC113296521 n=1 Tax=Papaver somniferum TaxID=3469 RepID=UPI000E6FC083|nr:uncharacterized protein LOC113296521 [Papaver somniferum]